MSSYKVGFIGGGNMARALVGGLLSSGYPPGTLTVAEPHEDIRSRLAAEFAGVHIKSNNADVANRVDCLVLAVKPQVMQEVCMELHDAVQTSRPLIISVAAGTHSGDIDAWMGGNLAIVRVMPNQPALILQGASALFANAETTSEQRDRATEIISAVGSVVHFADEDMLDAVTAISGTGPAYVYLLIDMMIRSAEDYGIDPQIAHKLVMDTAKGATALAAVSGETMEDMIARVRSPGGTTAAAFEVFDNEMVRDIFARAFNAAKDRATELANETVD